MQASHISKCLVTCWVAAQVASWSPEVAGADSTELINGPYTPTNVPGGSVWMSTPSAGGQIGKSGGVTWTFSDVPLAASNHVALWWGAYSNEVKLSFVDNGYTRPGEVFTYVPAESDLLNGKVVWRGRTPLGATVADTRFTMTLHNWTKPRWGNAISFDGTNDCVVLFNRPVSNDFTLECWFRSTQTTGSDGQWYQGNGLVDAEVATVVRDFGLSLGAGKVLFGTGGTNDTTIRSGMVADGRWHHVAATRQRSSGAMQLYVDGLLVASGTGGTNTLDSPQRMRFGSLNTGFNFFQGELDEVRFWNVVRDAADIRADMSQSLTGMESGLVAHYRFDEGTGITAYDSTANGWDARLANGATWIPSSIPSAWGHALIFDGVDDFIATPNLRNYFTNETVTIEAWFNAAGPGVIMHELGEPNLFWSSWYWSQIEVLATGDVGVRVYPWNTNSIIVGRVEFGTWNHVVLRYDKTTLLTDGFLNGVKSTNSVSVDRTAPWEGGWGLYYGIGMRSGSHMGDGGYFQGQLDEIRIWNVARSDAEIEADFRRRLTGLEPGLVAYWNFEDGSGSTASDRSTNGLHATIYGPIWTETTMPVPMPAPCPVEMVEGAGFGLSTNVGAVLRVTSGFSANLFFAASTNGPSGTFYPAYEVYDTWHFNTLQAPTYQSANSSVRGGFYYGYKPVITAPPVAAGRNAGSNVNFTVTATGLETKSYQWTEDGTPLAGATNATLALSNVQYNAQYVVTVTNYAGAITSTVATLWVTNSLGGEIQPPPGTDPLGTPEWEPRELAYWTGTRLYAKNGTGTLTVTWFHTNGYSMVRTVYVRSVPATPYEVGQVIPRPPGWMLAQPPDSVPSEAVYWHLATETLYAAAPASAIVTWYKSGGTEQLQVAVDSFWPTNESRYQVYVADSPAVVLSNEWANAQARLLGSDGTVGADSQEVEDYRRFQAPKPESRMPGTGNALLLLCPDDPNTTSNIYFQFVKCVDWQDPRYLHDHAPAIIGEPITNHFGYHSATATPVHLPNRLSPYCAEFFDQQNGVRGVTLIPVNRGRSDTPIDDMVAVFYAEGTNLWDVAGGTRVNSSTAWPHQAVRYDCQWPADAPTLVIASQKGSGPINLENWEVYIQNDTNQPGFNPNDEHALKYPANGSVPRLRANPRQLMVMEGGAAQVNLRLSSPPPADVFVTLSAWPGGDTNLSSPLLSATNIIAVTNWQTPRTVTFTAGSDGDTANGIRTFTLRAWGGIFATNYLIVHEADTNQSGLMLDALAFSIPEGTNRPIAVRLTARPTNDVTVRIDFDAINRDPSLELEGTNQLTFTASDWNTNQFFVVQAAADADVADGFQTFRVTASGALAATTELAVTALDSDPAPYAVYALRSDLGDPLGSVNSMTSEPYVLLTYTNAQGAGLMKVFRVVAEDSNHSLHYSGEAGKQIEPPYPLNNFVAWTESHGAAGPWWRDRKDECWAKAAGDDGGATDIAMRFFYRFQSDVYSFFFADGIIRTNNQPVPWLDRRPGGIAGVPDDVIYTITWPDDVPELRMGETLVKAKFGLPDIDGQTSVAVVYQQAEALGVGRSVQLIDPISHYTHTNLAALPGDVVTAINPLDGNVYFPALPSHLRSRLWYEATPPGKLHFKGEFRQESSTEEPVGFLLLNVITDRDKAQLLSLSQDPNFRNAVEDLANQAALPRLVGPNDVFEMLALTAGLATEGGYVTLAFNDTVRPPAFPADRGTPVEMSLIRVTNTLYRGDVKVIYSDDPFDEKVVLRHTGDFAGQADHYMFKWEYFQGTAKPPPDTNGEPVDTNPSRGDGVLDTVVPGLEGDNLRTLVDGWFRCQYKSTDPNHPSGANWSEWTEPALVEGWTKRVAARINPFDQKYTNLVNQDADTLVNMVSQAGARWIGDVPFNMAGLEDKGLIEIYESVLRRGINLSIEAINPVQSNPDASRSLLTIARRLADLYMLLGNEAYADASDPTIGYGTSDSQYGTVASSVFCFMDQVPSLIEEELGLLRGLDDRDGRNTRVYPAYHRLYWNFTRNITGGEVAYALNYNIRDESGTVPDSVSPETARKLYPQGHGDAWGHYLMAVKNFYRLLRNTNFVWSSEPEFVTVQGNAIPVNYTDERKFAQAAAAKARAGAEIVSLTYRNAYVDDPAGQWQGYLDGDTNRAWGVSEWASRVGQGAIFDWVTGNALVPASSTETGLAKVDRTTVTDLRQVAVEYENIQQQLDKANTGLNPLGLAKNVLPFDIDPQAIVSGKTQFEQVYERAVTAMNNAIAVFNYAVNCSQLLRRQADEFTQFEQNVQDREADFRSRLIEVFGTPYADDIGPGKTYPSGYNGPDLFNYMLTDYSEITGESPAPSVPFAVTYVETEVGGDGGLTQVSKPVTYFLAADGLGVVKDPSWTGSRAAPGEIQTAHSDLLQSKARFERSLREYDNLLQEIDTQAALLEAVHGLNAEEITVLTKDKRTQEQLNRSIRRARSRQENWAAASRMATVMANAVAEALPRSVGLSVDATSVARSGIMVAGALASETLMYKANREGLAELDHQQAKEMAQAQQNIDLTTIKQEQAILTQVAQLAQLVRQEVLLRLEVYAQQEAMQQMAGRYRSALARGQRLIEDRLRFRQQTAAHVQQARYKDMAFRIFRNEALQKYRAQFDLASMYVYLAAKAYDYETNLRPGDPAGPGAAFISQIVRARTIGLIESGLPQTGTQGDGGLADVMARMSANFSVLKPQLGLNNPQETALTFSLRKEFLRIVPGLSSEQWRNALAGFRVDDLNGASEFRQHCLFENPQPEPGLVIPLPTTVNKDMNYFGWPYGPADNKFNETASSIKIYSAGVSFSNYRITGSGGMANTPYVYLVPVGNDVLRCPRSSEQETNRFTRVWKVMDQWLPVPFDLGGPDGASRLAASDYIPSYAVGQGEDFLGRIRAFPAFRAWHDSLTGQNEADPQFNTTLLISRSVWNTKWLLVIPASSLGSDYNESLDRFIYGGIVNAATGQRDNNAVSDIRLRIKGYWYSGR